MYIYKATQLPQYGNTTNCWTQVITNWPSEINGNICSVQEVALAVVEITSTATTPCSQEIPTCFLDVSVEWGSTWLWDSLQLVGEENWLEETIQDGTCLAVSYGLYMKELYPDLCSAAFFKNVANVEGINFRVLPGTVGYGWCLSRRAIRTHGNSNHPSGSKQR